MATDSYWRKSGQIPAFGDWENTNELPITQYFECARQAGLPRCTCSGNCGGGSYTNNAGSWVGAAAVDMYGVGFHKPLPRRVYADPQPKQTRGMNKGSHPHSKEQRIRRAANKVSSDSMDIIPSRNYSNHHDSNNKYSAKYLNSVTTSTVKPVDEDLYKIPPELLQKSKRKKMWGFFSRCIFPRCSA